MLTKEQFSLFAQRMENGEVEALEELRKKIVVDIDLNDLPDETDHCLVASIYIAKRLTDDIWFNLALDASFDFPIDQLSEVASSIGTVLLVSLGQKNNEGYDLSTLLGSTIQKIYSYFRWIGNHPTEIIKGGTHGLTAKSV